MWLSFEVYTALVSSTPPMRWPYSLALIADTTPIKACANTNQGLRLDHASLSAGIINEGW